jgi:hypothetical protein
VSEKEVRFVYIGELYPGERIPLVSHYSLILKQIYKFDKCLVSILPSRRQSRGKFDRRDPSRRQVRSGTRHETGTSMAV